MPRLSVRTLKIVQQNVGEMLTDRCTIQRQTGATGTMGEPLNQLELIASDVPCRVIRAKTPNANSQMVIGNQKSMVERYRLICPVDTDFRVDDVVTVGDDIYQVVDVEDKLTDAAFAGGVVTRVRT